MARYVSNAVRYVDPGTHLTAYRDQPKPQSRFNFSQAESLPRPPILRVFTCILSLPAFPQV
ncbi:hypothetical protein P154DRAFT_520026 [Amniculicola lignicola CBS 123094]|uniref:Uncharacterized protein n=1 Tax=Amniculicola lignicola CBS 123094 TaxID=1392246 RepID=A0A6A5WRL6_9PLEO|nr:hypothetical protein P154DRAFT_520026 [Amniculicola lignicola CBS 123094]